MKEIKDGIEFKKSLFVNDILKLTYDSLWINMQIFLVKKEENLFRFLGFKECDEFCKDCPGKYILEPLNHKLILNNNEIIYMGIFNTCSITRYKSKSKFKLHKKYEFISESEFSI